MGWSSIERGLVALLSWLSLASLVSPASTAHADVPADLAGQPIVEIQIAGETAAVAAAPEVGVPIGTPLTRAVVRAAVERLLASGRFTDVQIDGTQLADGIKLTVYLEPRIVLHRVQISGVESVPESAVRDALRVSAGSEVELERLPELARAITQLYAERGYLSASAEVQLRDTDDPSSKVLMVRIDEGAPTRVRSLRFEGDQPLDPDRVLGQLSTGRGDIVDRSQLASDVGELEVYLREHGYLEARLDEPLVTVEGQDANVVIPSRLGPRYTVRILGSQPYAPSDVHEVLALDTEPLTPTHLRTTLAERVVDFYAQRGFLDARARVYRARGRQKNSAELVVAIESGAQVRVVAATFPGARHFDKALLRDQIDSYLEEELPGSTLGAPVDSEVVDQLEHGEPSYRTRAVPEPAFADPEQVYYAPAYAKAVHHVTELYHGEGFLSARVGPARLERVGKARAVVIVPVLEGPRTLLHAVRLTGAEALAPREVLIAASLQRGEPFSYLRLEQARRRILDAYHEAGHVFAKVDATVRFSEDKTRAEIELQVVEGFEVYVDRVIVKGAERTHTGLVKRVMELEPGDLYRPSAARESERQLALLGVFTGVGVALEDPDLPARVKSVVVTVTERRNQFLDFGAGLSTGQGIRGGFEYGYRNLFGEAVGMSLRVQLAYQLFFLDDNVRDRFEALGVQDRLERRISIGTTVPHLPGFGGVRTSLDLVHVRDNERDFGLDKNGVGLTFSKSPWQLTTVTLGFDLENNAVDLFEGQALADYLSREQNPRLRRLLRVPEGTSTLVAARTSASYDRRDSAFTPTRGYFMSASAELARTLSSAADELATQGDEFVSRFVKVSVTGSGYIPLGYDIVLAGQARAGRVFHLTTDSRTYPNRAFFLGGVDTMRGFLEDELVPQDVVDQLDLDDPRFDVNTIVRSGDAFVLFRGEVRFPLYGELRGGVFTDLGNLWGEPENMDPFDLRPTAGFGLRLSTPVGPIALDWGFNLVQRARLDERSNALHFSIGLF
jgi:outer membrane protein assembly complex protein YaeT